MIAFRLICYKSTRRNNDTFGRFPNANAEFPLQHINRKGWDFIHGQIVTLAEGSGVVASLWRQLDLSVAYEQIVRRHLFCYWSRKCWFVRQRTVCRTSGKQQWLQVTCGCPLRCLTSLQKLIGCRQRSWHQFVLWLAFDTRHSWLAPPSDNAAWAKIPDLAPAEEPVTPNVTEFGRLNERYVRERGSNVRSNL